MNSYFKICIGFIFITINKNIFYYITELVVITSKIISCNNIYIYIYIYISFVNTLIIHLYMLNFPQNKVVEIFRVLDEKCS